MDKSIITYSDYGNVKFDISKLVKEKKLSKKQICKRTGLHNQVVSRYYDGVVTRVDLDVLAKLCYILDCDITDILYYEKPQK